MNEMGGSSFDTPAVPAWMLKAIIIAWSSFAVAAVATMIFFAAFDPAVLAEAATYPFELSRNAGYTIGFLLLWVLTAAGSVVTLFLMRSLQLHPRLPQQENDRTHGNHGSNNSGQDSP